jgi:hypothetical protein
MVGNRPGIIGVGSRRAQDGGHATRNYGSTGEEFEEASAVHEPVTWGARHRIARGIDKAPHQWSSSGKADVSLPPAPKGKVNPRPW